MKKTLYIIAFYLFFKGNLYSQLTLNNHNASGNDCIIAIINDSLVMDKNKFPNTNIGKEALNIYVGAGYMPFSGNLSEYFKPDFGGTMSLNLFSANNMAYFLSLSGTSVKLKQNISNV